MEMRGWHMRGILLLLFFSWQTIHAQEYIKNCSVRFGKMNISLGKNLPESTLDSFIAQFDLRHLSLKRFIQTGFADSILLHGWKIETDTKAGFMITKPLESFDNINDVADRIIFMGENPPFNAMFPSVSNSVVYGHNRFRNKAPFPIKDSNVIFYHRHNPNAKKLMLAGSFNNWNPDNMPMRKTDSGWILPVKLQPGKYWYKFIADGNWTTDIDNQINENDGLGNVNSVYYVPNTLFKLEGYTGAKKVILSGSFNGWDEKESAMLKTPTGWELPVYLANGTHTYRFIVDRKWITDPSNPEKLPNEFNDFNSAIRKGPSYIFRLPGHADAGTVYLSGSFNTWRKNELLMKKVDGGWELPYVLAAGNYEYAFIVDGKSIPDPASMSTMRNSKSSSLVLNPNYVFRLKGFDSAKEIYLAGEFNNWSRTSLPMKKQDGEWVVTVHLSPGKHVYKFIVDGKWIQDPGNPLFEQNNQQSGNSVIWIE